jgi:hypothetical protein
MPWLLFASAEAKTSLFLGGGASRPRCLSPLQLACLTFRGFPTAIFGRPAGLLAVPVGLIPDRAMTTLVLGLTLVLTVGDIPLGRSNLFRLLFREAPESTVIASEKSVNGCVPLDSRDKIAAVRYLRLMTNTVLSSMTSASPICCKR